MLSGVALLRAGRWLGAALAAVALGLTGAAAAAAPAPAPVAPARAPAGTAEALVRPAGLVVFSDVPPSIQFYEEITWLAGTGITTGYSDGTYRPWDPVNRDAMAAFLYRFAGTPMHWPPEESPFTDITPSTPFYHDITWLAEEGVTTGFPDGTFRPWEPIARDAMAAFLYRFSGEPAFTPPAVSPFTDITPQTQFYKEITWLAKRGITTGYPDGSFRPLDPINRDAMAAFLYRLAGEPEVEIPDPPFFVYGSLRTGQSGYYLIDGRTIAEIDTRMPRLDLYRLSGSSYPYAVPNSANALGIVGQAMYIRSDLYASTMTRLDSYERYNPSLPPDNQTYVRVMRPTRDGVDAWVYEAGPRQADYLRANGILVGSGDWLRW